ncbi:C2 domain-containing protein [Auriculariales sp. MPI-PUGE-AT-0066]|nr:C2 domain-containing protein [Auriculariales sp. MPI-PUGE-AT-0066]
MSRQLGNLAVVVLKARNLPQKSLWKQSPYCVVRFEGAGQQTKIDERGGQHPVWDNEFRFPVADNGESKRILKMTVFTKELRVDDMIGEAQIDIMEHDVLRKGEFDDWVKLKLNGRDVGDVYVEMTFYSAAPPLARRPSKLSPHDRLWRPPQTPPKTPSPGRSPAMQSHLLPPGQEPQKRIPGDLPPAPNQRLHTPKPSSPPAPPKNDLPPAANQRLHAQPRPVNSPPTSPPQAPQRLSGEFPRPGPGEPQQAATPPAGAIPYRPPVGFDDFLLAPTQPALPQRPPQQTSLHSVPSILRPGHVRQQPSGGGSSSGGGQAARDRAAQEEEDARMAAELARAEGIDIEWLRRAEADAETARRLAAQGGHMPGAYP